MIAHNGVNMQGKLVYKTDDRTVSFKHRTGRILVKIK